LNERIKKLRKALDLTQQAFAEKIGCSRNLVANYEIGHRNPSSSVINNICKTFNVSETWLRTGAGEMFEQVNEAAELERKLREVLKDRPNSLQEKVITLLLGLDERCWDAIEAYARDMVESREKATQEAAETAREDELAALMRKDPRDMTDAEYDRYMREYRRQLLEEKKATERYSDTTSA